MRRLPLSVMAVLGCVLFTGSGCGGGSASAGQAPGASPVPSSPVSSDGLGGSAPAPPAGRTQTARPSASAAAPGWPTPEDCVSYNPANLTVNYEAGIHAVNDGTRNVARVAGGPGENVGQKALALAQRYRRHCFLGRTNTREDKHLYIFDYWRDPSGRTPAIAGQAEDCSGYERGNLTVEDMGSGHGWRVKDHDHVLHVFNNESDARNGRLVLARYGRICLIGTGDHDPGQVSYSL